MSFFLKYSVVVDGYGSIKELLRICYGFKQIYSVYKQQLPQDSVALRISFLLY